MNSLFLLNLTGKDKMVPLSMLWWPRNSCWGANMDEHEGFNQGTPRNIGISMDFKWSSASKQRGFDEDLDPVRGKPRLWEPQMNDGVLVGYLLWGWVKHLQPPILGMMPCLHGKKLSVNTFCWGWNLSSCGQSSNFGAGAWHEVKCLAWALSIAQMWKPNHWIQQFCREISLEIWGFSMGNLQVKPRCWPCETKNSAVRDAI